MSWFEAPSRLLPDYIALHGRWRADRTALVEGARRLTWREFERQTARVAHGMTALGLRQGDRVALLMDNSLEMALLIFGILRSGCVTVPLNVSITDTAVGAMIDDSNARVIFASGAHGNRIDALRAASAIIGRCERVLIGADLPGWRNFDAWLAAAAGSSGVASLDPSGDQECNIIYSSGTTGVPKGIVHSHRCRLHWAVDVASVLRYRSDCVTLCSLGLFSNITWVAMLATALVGGTMVVMPHFDAAAALTLIEQERVSHGTFVPLQLERLLAAHDAGAHNLTSLDTLMCCGSPLPIDVKREFPRRFGCSLIELYGLTEGLCTILAPEDFERKTESVGKPFLGSDLKILGEDDREVAVGETGEIVGYSPLLMSGYHNRDDANAEATWTDETGRRWLRTGDLGRVDAEGFLYIVDRKKDLILSGAQNVYPADIEAVMRSHPDVAEVAVVAARSKKWGETPVAIVVPKVGATPVAADLIGWTNQRVGKQQRITDVLWRDALPRNANGKILKRELRRELAGRVY